MGRLFSLGVVVSWPRKGVMPMKRRNASDQMIEDKGVAA